MAAKKASTAKAVTITIDLAMLQKLTEAIETLSELASAYDLGVDDPEVRKARTKVAKARTKKSR